VLNGPGPTRNFNCNDPAPLPPALPTAVQSGLQICGTTQTSNVPTPGVASYSASPVQPTNKIGSNQVTVYTQDVAGNPTTPATATVNYSVQYEPVGTMCLGQPGHQALPPADLDDFHNARAFKRGHSIPLRFRVCDYNGVSIGTPGVITSIGVTMVGRTDGDTPEDLADLQEDAVFHFDPTNQWWICNIRTRDLERGFTYTYTLTLNDGSILPFQFGLH
jgi:hypothetical protein